jgi:hypothetical protein
VIGEGVRRTQKLLDRYACRCGAKTCRGSILAPPKKKAKRTAAAKARGPAKRAKTAKTPRTADRTRSSSLEKRKSAAGVEKGRKTGGSKRAPAVKGPARRKSAARRRAR